MIDCDCVCQAGCVSGVWSILQDFFFANRFRGTSDPIDRDQSQTYNNQLVGKLCMLPTYNDFLCMLMP